MTEGADKIGLLAAQLMEEIENEKLPDHVSSPRVGAVGLVVEMRGDSTEFKHGVTSVKYRCTDTRGWVQAGLFLSASDASRRWGEWVSDT